MKAIVVILVVLLAALALPALSRADDNRQALMNFCLAEGETEGCCACGVDEMMAMFDDQEIAAMVELFNLMAEFEAAAGDEAKLNELMARATEVQGRLDEGKVNAMNDRITTACAGACPQQP